MPEENAVLEAYLGNHPRMIGVLFMLLLLLVQAGSAAANASSVQPGP